MPAAAAAPRRPPPRPPLLLLLLLPSLLPLLTCAVAAASTGGVRVCVTQAGEAACKAMVEEDPNARSLGVQCVSGQDRYGCLRRVVGKEADVTWATPEDVFLARDLYDDQLHVLAETRTLSDQQSEWRYSGVAVVRRIKVKGLEDLKGAKSCHTGYARTAGWNIPFSHLVEKQLVALDCGGGGEMTVVERDLRAASSFFGLACIPGSWAPDNHTNMLLKERYNNLCTMCGDPGRCDGQDPHAGYQGALRCLVDSFGDVAWTKMAAVTQFFKDRPEVSRGDFGLLCPDGRVQDLQSPKPCHWAAKPWHAWLVRASHENKKGITAALRQLVETAAPPPDLATEAPIRPWAPVVLGLSSPSVLHPRSPPPTPRDYLKQHGYDTTIERVGCEEAPVRLCVTSPLAHQKCEALAQVLHSRRVRPRLACLPPRQPDDCLATVARGAAHITTADGADVYRAHIEYGLEAVVTERYGPLDASYFAVAVVRRDSGITSLTQLRGKASCHTGIDKTAGWKIPVVALLEAGLLRRKECDFPGQMGRFFSASCAPGAKDPRYDPDGTNPDSLCHLCVGKEVEGASGPAYSGGDAEGVCARQSDEAFYGYTGAFRCLVEGGGDVAFVKHTTVRENTNGNNNATWAANLRALDFRLLCRDEGTDDVTAFESCHLARVPAHKVVTGLKEGVMKEEVRILLLRASEALPPGQDVFHMFGSYRGRPDLIFKNSATELVNVREDTFHQSLEDTYYRSLSQLSSCTPSHTPLHLTGTSASSSATTGRSSSLTASLAALLTLPVAVMVSRAH